MTSIIYFCLFFSLFSVNNIFPINNVAAKSSHGILGQQAPELGIKEWIDGNGEKTKSIKIKDYKGKVIYLFFFQDWCPGCKSHGFPTLKKVSDALKDNKNVKFLVVQTVFEGHFFNSKSKLRKNQKKFDLKIPFAHDDRSDRNSTMAKYRSGGTPWAVIIDPTGKVVFNDFHLNPDKAIPFIKNLTNVVEKNKRK